MRVKLSKSQWEKIGKTAGWMAVDSPFNQKNYPDAIGKEFENPPSYVQVKRTNAKDGLEQIWRHQTRWLNYSPEAETSLEDFAIKAIRAGYDKEDIVEGIREHYNQAPEVGENIYDRVFNRVFKSKSQ